MKYTCLSLSHTHTHTPEGNAAFFRYRRFAVRYKSAQEKNGGAETIFALAAEAYDVLSDPFRRAVYDQYGEEGLKNGVPTPEGFVKPYVYHGEPMRTFRWKEKLSSYSPFYTENAFASLLYRVLICILLLMME